MVTVCVDVMGSDKEPAVLLEGVAAALEADPELAVLVAGAPGIVEAFCAKHERARALPCTEVIGMAEHPASAVRRKKDASIVRAAAAVRAGEADGLFSAGSTGAVLTAATFGVGRIKGIKRPALALPMPGAGSHKTVFLDMGANADVKPDVMVQFAHMGRAYAKVALGVGDARVGLLCNGSEETKGSELALAYHEALAAGNCGFAGNAEGTDLLGDSFDVIVADGFTGNVALKSLEGTGKYVLGRLKAAMGESLLNKIGLVLLKKSLKSVAADLSGDEYGGAILLGLKAPVVKGHGATSSRAVTMGVLHCAAAVREDLSGKIAQACDHAA